MSDKNEQLAEDMNEAELAEGIEGALEGERQRVERNLDADDDVDDADDAPGDDIDDGADHDDDDDDDDLDDDEDLDDDDDEGEGEPEAKAALPDGYTRDDKGRVHRPDGTIASNEEVAKLATAKAPAKTGEAPADKTVATDAAKTGVGDKAPAPTAAKWEPYKVTADKQEHAIPEAVGIQRANGHVFIAIPEGKFNDFNRRIGMGIVGARMSRDLDTKLKETEELQRELKENPRPTEAQIEAEVWLKALKEEITVQDESGETVRTTRMARAFEARDLDLLSRDVKIALHDAEKGWNTKREERAKAQTDSAAEEQRYDGGLSEAIALVQEENQAWLGVPIEQLREIFAELRPATKSLLGKDTDGSLFLTDHGARLIRRALTGVSAGTKPAAATGADSKPATATADDKGDRFNSAQDTAKKPPTTSVKAGSRGDTQRSRHRGNRDDRRNGKGRRRDGRTREQRVEDDARALEREWMKSSTLDFA